MILGKRPGLQQTCVTLVDLHERPRALMSSRQMGLVSLFVRDGLADTPIAIFEGCLEVIKK